MGTTYPKYISKRNFNSFLSWNINASDASQSRISLA
jgi:hypothetical protein